MALREHSLRLATGFRFTILSSPPPSTDKFFFILKNNFPLVACNFLFSRVSRMGSEPAKFEQRESGSALGYSDERIRISTTK
jgi:hypothetical protein